MKLSSVSRTFSPAITRMLLASDGSTTLLLEALTGGELTIDVLYQGRAYARDFPPEISDSIGVGTESEILVRRSRLRTATGEPISKNLVVARREHQSPMLGLLSDRHAPLGRGLISLGLSQARHIVATGEDWWDESPTGEPCAYKAYVLVEQGNPVLYIHEKFNPLYVPLKQASCCG
ncbi:chorismate--pyruvate lyase family protein [Streptomyces milbemycinicus]|uniref:Chorismate--pyruvate lyase family protein n=1 Tax=Streptomyces milbemycinicus TaxID=476552 RepID=A0ABW8LE90_9ACTN